MTANLRSKRVGLFPLKQNKISDLLEGELRSPANELNGGVVCRSAHGIRLCQSEAPQNLVSRLLFLHSGFRSSLACRSYLLGILISGALLKNSPPLFSLVQQGRLILNG